MAQFALIFDHLEFSNYPTLHNVVPSFYVITSYCQIKEKTPQKQIINTLKFRILNVLNDKYWNSITTLHWIATYLEPTFKSLTFINDKKDREKRLDEIRKGLHVLIDDVLINSDDDERSLITSTDPIKSPPPPRKKHKNDPFADIRQQAAANSSSSSSNKTTESLNNELDRQIDLYNNTQMSNYVEYENNPLSFWKREHKRLPLLARIARSVFAIQGNIFI
jgi:hypothetical protein